MSGLFFRLLLKAMVPLVIVLGGLSYVMYLRGHDPLAMLSAPFQAGGGVGYGKSGVTQAGEPLQTIDVTSKVYRWKGPDGTLHFSDKPPGDGRRFQALDVDPDANLIRGLGGSGKEKQAAANVPVPANPYHPDSIKRLFDQAEAVKETLDQRYREQQKLLER